MDKKLALNECEQAKELITELESGFLLLGEKLSAIYRKELWHCGQWDSWDDYCDYFGKPASVVSRLITVYEKLIEEWKIDQTKLLDIGGWNTAYRIAKTAKNKTEAVALLNDIKGKTPRDREIAVRSFEKGVDQDKCKHKDTYKVEICRTCGMRIKMYDS